MPVQPTVHPVRLDSMSMGELAVAIHAAGSSTTPSAIPVEQVKALALAGVARLGVVAIRRIHDQARLINLSYCNKTRDNAAADVSGETQAHHRIWSTWRQEQVAVDLAFRLSRAMRSGEVTY